MAPGGASNGTQRAVAAQVYSAEVVGTRVSFDYGHSSNFESIAGIRREADRDAAEALAVANEHRAT
jgi:hypothetical protein